jgi:hypothetical protein
MCPNGTVNWKAIYGEEAFILKPPVYESELRARRQRKDVNIDELEKRAQEFAKVGVMSTDRGAAAAAAAAAAGVRGARHQGNKCQQQIRRHGGSVCKFSNCMDLIHTAPVS